MTIEELLDAWRVNNAVNLELLDACPDDAFELKPGSGKTIRSNFVHLVGVRRMFLEDKMKAQAAEVPKLDWKSATREEIRAALIQTESLVGELFCKMETSNSQGAWSAVKFFAYAVAHEAHHRSQIEIALRIGGKELDGAFLYGLWEWSKK